MRMTWARGAWLVLVGVLAMTACDGGGEPADATAVAPAEQVPNGEQTYNRFCFSCHAAGLAGAPKVGDLAAWKPRIAKGEAALLKTTIDGMPPGMPARGMCAACTDDELELAVAFMVERSR